MDTFSPSWKDLLHPVLMPIKAFTPAASRYNNYDPKPEPPSYIHLGKRIPEPTDDINEKLHSVLDNEVLYLNIDELKKDEIDEVHFKNVFEASVDINLVPDDNAARTNEKLKLCHKDCLGRVLEKIPASELAEHGITIQTYRIDISELDNSYYLNRVNEVVKDFLTRTVVRNNYICNDNIMQVFLYEAYLFLPGRLFTKFSADRARDHIEEILKYFIDNFHIQNELEQLVELLYLEHYKLSPTIFSVLRSSLTDSLNRRPFFNNLNVFMQSPCYLSATHGLQRLCRKKILICLLKCHVRFLVEKLRQRTLLTVGEEGKVYNIFLQTCVAILALPKLDEW